MKKKSFLLIALILCFFVQKVNAENWVFSGYSDTTDYNIGKWADSYDSIILHGITISVGYKTSATDPNTGCEYGLTGSTLSCGDSVRLTYSPGSSLNTAGYGSSISLTAGSTGCPAGQFVTSAAAPTACLDTDMAITTIGANSKYVYTPLRVIMPAVTLTPSGLTCGSLINDGSGTYHKDCVVTRKTGTATANFSFAATTAYTWSAKKYNTSCYGNQSLKNASIPAVSKLYTFNTAASPNEQNASCGTAAKSYASTDASYSGTFCAAGTAPTTNPSFPAAGGSISWTCTGIACGTSVTCTATRAAAPVNGACGTMAKAYAATDTAYSGTRCSAGTSNPTNPAFPAAGSSTTWSCNGSNGGTNASCTATRAAAATNGTCGSSNGTAVYTIPTTNLCTYTTSTTTTVSGTGPWTWTCTGSNGGINASCSAPKKIDGSCGGAAKVYSSTDTAFSGSLCNDSGTTTPATVSYPSVGNSVTWTCSSPNGGLQSGTCTASRTAAAINGTCGTAATTYSPSATAFSGTLCSAGISNPTNPTFPTSAGSSVSWICNGENGGTNSGSCTATRNAYNNCTGPDETLIAHGGSKVYYLAPSVIAPATCTGENRVCNNGVLSGNYTYPSCTIGVINLNPICQSYQNGIATTTILVNQDMEWKVIVGTPALGDTSYTINSSLSGNFILDLSNSIISLTKLYQQTGVKTFSAQLTGVPSGRVGTCSTNANVVIGDQITVEQ